MDNAYRFGRIEVSCEGYSNPADALILKGSCGLEYTLELTEHGRSTSHGGTKSFGGRRIDDAKSHKLEIFRNMLFLFLCLRSRWFSL